MKDLFENHNPSVRHRGKMGRLVDWLEVEKIVKTSDVVRWGLDHFCISAERYCRSLAEEGFLERLSDEEKLKYVGKSNQDVWRVK